MKKILFALMLAPVLAFASTEMKLDKLPSTDKTEMAISLQRGVQTFVNYCLNCHSASYMRYNRLQDLGLTEQQIKQNLMFPTDKVGDTMSVAMNKKDGKSWFGAAPPDLSVIARVRGGDWLYTYLRTFYRDPETATGWNNIAFPNVGMPHVLYQLQGEQALKVEEREAPGGKHEEKKLVLVKPGSMNKTEYDTLARDLVNYLVYMGEPARSQRVQLGIIVLAFLSVVFVLAYLLKKEYWKDVH